MSEIIVLTKNPNFMWFVSFGCLAITFATWRISENKHKWKIAYESFKYITAGCLFLMFLNMY